MVTLIEWKELNFDVTGDEEQDERDGGGDPE